MEASHNNVVVKLSKVDAVISKIRHSVDIQVLKLVYHAICKSCSFDASLVYHKLKDFLFYKKISQDNVFLYRNAHTDPLSKNLKEFKVYQQNQRLILVYSLVNLSTRYFQKYFLTGSHYLLNIMHITPDGQTKVLSLFLSIVPKPIEHIYKY